MIRIALVDDDREHLKLMKSYLERYAAEEHIPVSAKEFCNGLNFVEDYDWILWKFVRYVLLEIKFNYGFLFMSGKYLS